MRQKKLVKLDLQENATCMSCITNLLRARPSLITRCDSHLAGTGRKLDFGFPIKIPPEDVVLMVRLPENTDIKIFHGGTLASRFSN